VADKDKYNRFQGLLRLGIIWLVGAVGDRIWFALDRSVPAWDQADYLTGSLNYWQALQQPHWFSNDWWTSFWLLSSKIPPLIYVATAFVQNLFGTGPDQATLINLLSSAILLGSVYGLGVQLFSVKVGLWAAGLCQVLPGLYRFRLDFLLDYPLTAFVTLSFCCLTVWRDIGTAKTQRTQRRGWLWAAAFGVSLGLVLLVKQTALFFLLIPVLWVGVVAIRRRNWGRISQLVGGLLLSVVVFGPWYRTNWLVILTSGKRATVDSAIAEGDPGLNTLAAWTYYWNVLPDQVSWTLLLVPLVGLILYWKRLLPSPHLSSLRWLAVFWIGAYLLSSLNINKDDRYVLPYLPVLSLFLAYGLTCWVGRWGHRIRWGSVGLAVMLMFLNLFPVGGVLGKSITQTLSPNAQHHAYLGPTWPHTQVIDEIIQKDPYLRSTLGVLPSTPEINQHNFNYYGALEDFQVYGRQVGIKEKQICQDVRSLDWFLTKTGDQGSVPEAQATTVQTVEQSPDFYLDKAWNLPDGSTLKLYHRRTPLVQVQPLTEFRSQEPGARIALAQVTVPKQVPPGVPVPVIYEWSGSWEQLQSGLVLLNWRDKGGAGGAEGWLHDHGIGMGALHPSSLAPEQPAGRFEVIERMAMLPPSNVPSGTYTLEATYLNRLTGENYPIPVPPVTLKIDPDAVAVPAPELDLLTQLRTIAANLPKGPEALGLVFEEIARINQYDPIQDYLVQTQLALDYRLQLEPQNRDWAYALALSKVLTRSVNGAIAALIRVTQLDSQNPYSYAYLAFVHLYDWHPSAAEAALKSAVALNPNLPPEIQALRSVAALMQGNLVQAWHLSRGVREQEVTKGDK
jgi:4-amino-4-deoxy-L-arabinose transferase-like glycosyltransferase